MKNLLYSLLALLLALSVFEGCDKLNDPKVANGQLVVSKYTIKVNQPDSMALKGAPATDSIHWSVTPAGYQSISKKNNGAVIVFTKAGIYTVKVSDNGAAPVTASITVAADTLLKGPITGPEKGPGDTTTNPANPVTYTTLPLTGDQITLNPYFHQDAAADTAYIYFIAKTTKYYCSNSTLVVSYSLANNKYSMNFLDVVQPNVCVLGQTPISAGIYYTSNQPGPLSNGTYQLSVTLNGTTYTGSMTVTSTKITFNWDYTSGVIISPAQITR